MSEVDTQQAMSRSKESEICWHCNSFAQTWSRILSVTYSTWDLFSPQKTNTRAPTTIYGQYFISPIFDTRTTYHSHQATPNLSPESWQTAHQINTKQRWRVRIVVQKTPIQRRSVGQCV